jgi:hypothetical protein
VEEEINKIAPLFIGSPPLSVPTYTKLQLPFNSQRCQVAGHFPHNISYFQAQIKFKKSVNMKILR